MKRKIPTAWIVTAAALIGCIAIAAGDPSAGRAMGKNIIDYALSLLKVLPQTFILIGLFEVWVKRERVEKHLGEGGGFASFLWALLLGGVTIGPMLVALPVAASLYRKGARLSVIFTYIAAAGVCRIPMTLLESSYMGVKFTIIRYTVSIPLIILSSVILGRILKKKEYAIEDV